MHQINANGDKSGIRYGIEIIREQQAAGNMGYGYIFADLHWLAGGVWWSDVPPLAHRWYIIVPTGDGQPTFHHGMDSMAHLDISEYVKWIRTLNLW